MLADPRWTAIAARDLLAAETLLDGDRPVPEIAAYLCQQAAEKIVKGVLAARGVDPPWTHDVGRLVDMLADGGAETAPFAGLRRLTVFATLYRYPSDVDGEPPPPAADEVRAWIAEIRAALRAVSPAGPS